MNETIDSGYKYFFPERQEKPEDASIFYRQKESRIIDAEDVAALAAEDVAALAAEDDWHADPSAEPCDRISVIAPDGKITIWEIRYEDTRNFYADEVTP